MTIIRATCDQDGTKEYLPGAISVLVDITNKVTTFSFVCRDCKAVITGTINSPSLLKTLLEAGVKMQKIKMPLQVQSDQGPITCDEMLDFHISLENEISDLLAELG